MMTRHEQKKMCWLGLTLWLVSLTTVARAEQAELVWERDPGAERCPAAGQIAQAVNARLGYVWLVPGQQGGERAFGRVSKVDPGYELLLTLRDRDKRLIGTRRLHDPAGDCATLASASVLALTLMAAAAPPALPATAGPTQRVAFAVEAGAAGSLGLLSAPSVHAFVRMDALLTRRFALELEVIALGGVSTALPDSPARVRTTPVLGMLGACVVLLRVTHLRWDGCLGVVAGALHAQGEQFSERSLSAWSPFVAPVARLPLRIQVVGPLQAGIALNFGVPLQHPEYRYLDPEGRQRSVRESDPVFGWLELGLGATF
jgi:hypothetical protein